MGNPKYNIKLSQNENAFGVSPRALKAIAEYSSEVFRYPDIFHRELVLKLAGRFGLAADQVIITAGLAALMDISIKALVGFTENIITGEVTFPGYKIMAKINRRACRLAPLENNRLSVKNILAQCDAHTRLIFIANPNNPTSTIISHDELKEVLDGIGDRVFVAIDEAYVEYVCDPSYPNSLALLGKYPNLIIFRSFSKIYGLAGLRVGYGLASETLIQTLVQHKTPFSVNSLAAAAAAAALDDEEYIEKCAQIIAEERTILFERLINLGFKPSPPQGNFIFIEFDDSSQSDSLYDFLAQEGIFVRKLGPFGTDRALRITIGSPKENRTVIETLEKYRT